MRKTKNVGNHDAINDMIWKWTDRLGPGDGE